MLIVANSKATNFDALLVTAVIETLSSFNPRAESGDGRIGLTQLSPHAGRTAARLAQVDWDAARLVEPEYNLLLGLHHLRYLRELFEGNMSSVLMAFCAGSEAVAREQHERAPAFVQNAVSTIEARYRAWTGLKQEEARPAPPAVAQLAAPDGQAAAAAAGPRPVKEVLREVVSRFGLSGSESETMSAAIVQAAAETRSDPLLLAAVAAAASDFAGARSVEGRVGLMQISSAKGAYMAKVSGVEWQGEARLHDNAYNVKLGAAYLAFLNKVFQGKTGTVLIAYHYGAREYIEAMKAKQPIPETTTLFVRRVLAYRQEWAALALTPAEPEQKSEEAAAPAAQPMQQAPREQPRQQAGQSDAAPSQGDSPALAEGGAPVVEKTEPQYFEDELARMSHIVCSYGIPPQECGRLAGQIVLYSDRFEMDALLVAALIKEQSNFFWFARSNNPVRIGLFQLNPEEAVTIADRARVTWGGAGELKNPAYALRLGVAYLRALRAAFGGPERILTGFYWGPDEYVKAIKARRGAPPEVKNKVAAVLATYNSWRSELRIKK